MTTRIKVYDLILFVILVSVLTGILYDLLKKWQTGHFSDEKIDWHDWNLINKDNTRRGLGEQGEKAYLTYYPAHTKDINDSVGYNGYLSDKIALDRSLKDLRPPQ